MSDDNKSNEKNKLTRRGMMKAMGLTAGAAGINLVPGGQEQSPPPNPTPVPPVSNSNTGQGSDPSVGSPPVDTGEYITTNNGTPISDDQNTLRAGPRGPSLLEDFHFREKLTHFDH